MKEKGSVSGQEEFNYFMSILYHKDQLNVLPYNRMVHQLDLSPEDFIKRVKDNKIIVSEAHNSAYTP